MFRQFILFVLLFVFSFSISAQEITHPILTPMIDNMAHEMVGENSPGFVMGVVQDGDFVFLKGYGLADVESKRPITADTQFDIGSVSKQFTAMCIAMLYEEGKISLDDDVRKYVPEIPDYGQTITIRQLIYHTSGLRDHANLMLLAGMDIHREYQIEEMLDFLARQKSLNFMPGDQHLYCNTGYFLMGVIVKRVTGKTLGEFALERIFNPLGMKNTLWLMNTNDPLPGNRATGYIWKDNNFQKGKDLFRVYDGAGGIQTTANDMRLWMNNYSEKKIGDAALYEFLNTRGILNNGDTISYSFGLVNSSYGDFRKISHDGGTGNFMASCERYPDLNLELIFFTNTSGKDAGKIFSAVVDKLYPDENELTEINQSLLDKFVGIYEMQGGFRIEITEENGKLFSQGAGQPKFEIFASSDTSYYLKVVSASIDFRIEENGKVNMFILHQGGQNIPFKRVVMEEMESKSGSSELLERFVGAYAMNDAFRIAITLEEGKLYGQGTGQPKFELFASSDTSFYLKVVEASIDFRAEKDGSVNLFTLHQGGKDIPFRRVDENEKISEEDFENLQGEYYSADLDVTYKILAKGNKLILEAPDFGDLLPVQSPAFLDYLTKDKFSLPLRTIRVMRDSNHQITGFYLDFGRAANIEFNKK